MTPLDGIAPEDFPGESTSREDAARWYLARGIPVFAVCAPDGSTCTGKGLDLHGPDHKIAKTPIRKWKNQTPSEKTIIDTRMLPTARNRPAWRPPSPMVPTLASVSRCRTSTRLSWPLATKRKRCCASLEKATSHAEPNEDTAPNWPEIGRAHV